MKKELAEKVIEILQNEFGETCYLIENYSGKFMFGSTTCAIECKDASSVFFALGIIYERFKELRNYFDFEMFRCDEMALNYVVY